jgi:hypothetical protein
MARTKLWMSSGDHFEVNHPLGDVQGKLNENSGLPVLLDRVGGGQYLVNPQHLSHAQQMTRDD